MVSNGAKCGPYGAGRKAICSLDDQKKDNQNKNETAGGRKLLVPETPEENKGFR